MCLLEGHGGRQAPKLYEIRKKLVMLKKIEHPIAHSAFRGLFFHFLVIIVGKKLSRLPPNEMFLGTSLEPTFLKLMHFQDHVLSLLSRGNFSNFLCEMLGIRQLEALSI